MCLIDIQCFDGVVQNSRVSTPNLIKEETTHRKHTDCSANMVAVDFVLASGKIKYKIIAMLSWVT